MWVNPCAHDILFSPTGICVQIFIWIQRKLNYSFLGKKLPAVQESSVIYNYGVFFLPWFAAEDRYLKFWQWAGSAWACSRTALSWVWQPPWGCCRALHPHSGQGRGPGEAHAAAMSKPTMVHSPEIEWDWGWKYMRRLVNRESASARSRFSKIITLFPHSFAKITGIVSIINFFFHLFLHAFYFCNPLASWPTKVMFSCMSSHHKVELFPERKPGKLGNTLDWVRV